MSRAPGIPKPPNRCGNVNRMARSDSRGDADPSITQRIALLAFAVPCSLECESRKRPKERVDATGRRAESPVSDDSSRAKDPQSAKPSLMERMRVEFPAN